MEGPGVPAPSRTSLRFKVFGSFEAWSADKRIHVGGKQSIGILTLMLCEAGNVVPVNTFVDAIWDVDVPATAAHQVRKMVADLRQRIPSGRDVIITDGAGYRVDTSAVEVDFLRFHDHLARASRAVETTPHEAIDELAAAIASWSPILSGTGGPVLDAVSTLTHARYLGAAEKYFELRLRADDPNELIPLLHRVVQQDPFAERLRGQLMKALYRADRPAEALHQFETYRRSLAEELGVDPSGHLRDLHLGILANNDRLLGTSLPLPVPGSERRGIASPGVGLGHRTWAGGVNWPHPTRSSTPLRRRRGDRRRPGHR